MKNSLLPIVRWFLFVPCGLISCAVVIFLLMVFHHGPTAIAFGAATGVMVASLIAPRFHRAVAVLTIGFWLLFFVVPCFVMPIDHPSFHGIDPRLTGTECVVALTLAGIAMFRLRPASKNQKVNKLSDEPK